MGSVASGSTISIRRATSADVEVLGELTAQASAEAQSPALNEQTLLSLQSSEAGGPSVYLADEAGTGATVGALAVHEGDNPITAELVLPDGPSQAIAGAALLTELDRIAADHPSVPTRLWTHGRLSPVGALAQERGYRVQRLLSRLVRPGALAEPAADLAPGVRIAPFRPGIDDQAWLEVNAAAFADHPEQGQWTQDDLQNRIESEWFDPAGFFLAWSESNRSESNRSETNGSEAAEPTLLGFHWTKTEPDPRHDDAESGEVYVIGVAPQAAGLHLGSALLSTGLRHLRELGVERVYLYVDGDNERAVSLYLHVGFIEDDVDICFDIR